jgi:release factor glutamine methyltransferase
MEGLIDNAWMVERLLPLQQTPPKQFIGASLSAYFGLGHCVELKRNPGVFEVSPAGLALGAYLVKSTGNVKSGLRFLDVGTGSGVHALLARQLGYEYVRATDICERSVLLARQNERNNFVDECISFEVGDLFEGVSDFLFDRVVFNPPGWRAPSDELMLGLHGVNAPTAMPLCTMFYGDEVLLRFLHLLPRVLDRGGVALVGLNSLVGIRDVLQRYKLECNGVPPLNYRLVERHAFPLFLYDAEWSRFSGLILNCFQSWRQRGLAAYSTDSEGNMYWPYEIVEFFHAP